MRLGVIIKSSRPSLALSGGWPLREAGEERRQGPGRTNKVVFGGRQGGVAGLESRNVVESQFSLSAMKV